MMDDWHVAQLKPGGLAVATRNLDRQKIPVFTPTVEELRATPRGTSAIRRQLFHGYLFVRLAERDQHRKVNGTLGITRLITSTPAGIRPMPAEFMAALFARCDADGQLMPERAFRPGDQVSLVSGPFAGLLAEVEKVSSSGRIHILLQVLGRSVRSETDVRHLDLAAAAAPRR